MLAETGHCYGELRVHADALGFALGPNAIAHYLAQHPSDSSPPGAMAA